MSMLQFALHVTYQKPQGLTIQEVHAGSFGKRDKCIKAGCMLLIQSPQGSTIQEVHDRSCGKREKCINAGFRCVS